MHKETEKKIEELLKEGKTEEQIAEELELKVRTVILVKRKCEPDKCSAKRGGYPQELIDEWDKLHRKYGNKGGK